MKLRAIIADDETLGREGLRLLLEEDPQVEVVKECSNGRETIEAVQTDKADVLFLDIEMPGINGFDVVKQIGIATMPIVVFITAHNEYALKAFEAEALDYLTKPLETERLRHTLRRVKERVASHAAPVTQAQLQSVFDLLSRGAIHPAHPQRLLVPNGTRDVFVTVDEIEWIEADRYYCALHIGPKRYLLRETIKQLACTLDPKRFVRVHRSAIVNMRYVKEILKEGQNESWLILSNGHRVKMSKSGWQNLLDVTRN